MSYLLRNNAFDVYNIRERRKTADRTIKNPRKSASPNFFQNGKIATCTRIKIKNDKPVAVPFKMVNENSKKIEEKFHQSYYPLSTQYRTNYDNKQTFNSSSLVKPLKKYNAFCDRNRMPRPDTRSQSPYINNVLIGNQNDIQLNKSYLYATEYKARMGNHYDTEYVSHPGSIARINLFQRKKLAKY